jgi:multidrug efflux system membrane fusion protein
VRIKDVPIFLDGLGTVQAFNSVEIKAQVTGLLIDLPAREGQEVNKGDVVARIDPASFKASLDAAVAQRSEDEAELQSAQLDLRRFQALAARSYAPVQQVDDQQATGIVSITQDQPIAVVLTLPEDELLQVQNARAKGPVAVEAYDSQGKALLARGTLLTPNNVIDTSTGTISLKAEFSNTDGHLWPGQFVNTRVQIDTLRKAVTIPSLSVQHGPDGLFVYLVKPDQTVAQTAIDVGYVDSGLSVVTKGLSDHGVVVLAGQSRLAPGMHVKVTNTPKQARLSAGQPAVADPS